MNDFDYIINLIENISNSEASLIIRTLAFVLFVLFIFNVSRKFWTDNIQPFLSNDAEKHRNKRRQRFAEHIAREINHLNLKEAWKDYRFAELEAELEAEASWKKFGWRAFFKRSQEGVRRIPSLSKALELSTDKYILVEGEPGSGKSVALRYVAKQLASKAAESNSNKSIIPLYINLRELGRDQNEAIDRSLIERFILQTLNRVNDRDIDAFLEDEFQRGLRDGSWFFLFDSFDEIPEVLSSTEKDKTVISYAEAISDFLHGMNECRGVIASRQFKGPKLNEFREFTILALSEERKRSLIKKAMLKKEAENELLGGLSLATQEINDMSKNPLFLSLLCEHIGSGQPFPENGHVVFETYINSRLNKDEDRLFKRFRITPKEVRLGAEIAAFAMLAEKNIGLSPTREQLIKAISHQNMTILSDFNKILDALEYIKLARSVEKANTTDPKNFTFAHRRFQEYFATNMVLREPHRIDQKQLLTDARWRETAVVLFQTQSTETITPLLREAHNILQEIAIKTSNVFKHSQDFPKAIIFPWLPNTLHVINLLQDSFGNRLKDVSPEICTFTDIILCPAYDYGIPLDKKWAIGVAGVIPQDSLLRLIRESLEQSNKLFQDAAYSQVSRLKKIPPDVANWVLQSIVNMAYNRKLARDKLAIRTYLQRLENPQRFISSMDLLLYAPKINLILHFTLLILLFAKPIRDPSFISTLNISTEIAYYINLLSIDSVLYYLLAALCFILSTIFREPRINEDISEGVTFFIIFGIIRSCLLAMPLLFFSIDTQMLYAYLAVIAYLATWYSLSLIIAQIGKFNSKIWWPFLHLGVIIYSILNFKTLAKRTRKYLLEDPTLLVKLGSLIIITPFIIVYEITKHILNYEPIIEMGIRIFGMFVLMGIVVSIILTISAIPTIVVRLVVKSRRYLHMLINSCQEYISDWKKWRHWLKNRHIGMTGDEIIELIHHFHNNSYPNQIIERIHTENLINPAEHTERALQELVLAVENRTTLNRYEIPWFANDNSDFITQLTLLQESIHNRRIFFDSSVEAEKSELSSQPISAS